MSAEFQQELLWFRVLRFRSDEDWNIGVSIFPEREEILLGRLGFGGVALHGIGLRIISSNQSEAEDVAAAKVGAALEGIILCGENTRGRLLGVGIALEIVNEGSAGIETETRMAGSIEFDCPTKVEGEAPGAFVRRGAAGNKCLVVMDEAVAHDWRTVPSCPRSAEFKSNKAFLRATVLTVGAGARKKIHDGIEIGILREPIIEIKTVAG